MTKGNFLRYYNKLTGADQTLVFFIYKHVVYIWNCKHVAPRWVYQHYESQSKGGHEKYRMYITTEEKQKLICKGAIPVMTEEQFNAINQKNKGHKCESWLHEVCGLGKYTPDHERFDKCGDICINGVQYQVKFENATLTNVEVLHKAQKNARKNKNRG